MGPDLDIPLEPQRLCEHCGFRDKEASPDEDSVWLCDDCRDEDTYYNATQEARELIDRLEKENSELLRKFDRAAELLRRIRKENPLLSTDIARDARTFLDGLEGK